MVSVTVEMKEKETSRCLRITAPSIERALEIAGEDEPGREVRVIPPMDPEDSFAGSGMRAA